MSVAAESPSRCAARYTRVKYDCKYLLRVTVFYFSPFRNRTCRRRRRRYANRVVDALPLGEYSLANCLAHAFYVPLYLAGPTVTFNAFASQMARPQTAHRAGRVTNNQLKIKLQRTKLFSQLCKMSSIRMNI